VNYFLKCMGFAALAFSATGCISTKSYVEPQYKKATYESIERLAEPLNVKITVTFLRNGEPLPAADGELRGHVERVIRASGVFTPSTAAETKASFQVRANNIADLAAARMKGFGTGLSLGAAGSTIDDNYEFEFTYVAAGKTQTHKYLHTIHSTVGNAKPPAGIVATTPADAFSRVVEDVTLNFINDIRKEL
jgi:hypothetical protein